MKFLVTGATGFIGNHFINKLLEYGHTVIATSSNRSKAEKNNWFSKVEYIEFDLSEKRTDINLVKFFGNPDKLIHLAWNGLPNYQDISHLSKNLSAQWLFLENMVANGIKEILVTGTCLEYGLVNGCLSENMITQPLCPYAISKDTIQKGLTSLRRSKNFKLKWVRLFYAFGEGQSPSSLYSQLNQSLDKKLKVFNMSGGDQIRDFLPVEKMIDNLYCIAMHEKFEGIVNCCSGNPISVRKIVEEYLTKIGALIKLNFGYYPYPDYEGFAFWGDSTKLKSIIQNEI
jgi:dTDP-6-deoxy-L-talose 4-dehydrogenase (NAD+)